MERTVTVQGTGKLSAQPDLIVLELTLNAKHRDYAEMTKEAGRQADAMREAVRQAGLDGESLKTAAFRVNTDYEHGPDAQGVYRQKFVGYICVHSLRLELPMELPLLADVLGAIGKAEIQPEMQISFQLHEPEKRRAEALQLAAQSARESAETLAAASGVSLGRLVSVSYGDRASVMQVRTECNMLRAAKGVGGGMADSIASVVPDAVTVEETAVFVWEITG